MLGLLVIWAALLIALVIFAIGRRGGALTLAYFLMLSLIHVPGVLPFLTSDSGLADWDETELGFEATILGMSAFVAGAVLARRIDLRRATEGASPLRRAQAYERLGWRAFVLGIIAYFLVGALSARVPSMSSVVSASATLLILGLWLVLYGAAVATDWRRTLATLALLPLLPLGTLATGGFLGFGVYWVLSVLAFLFVITRHRIWFYLGTPVAAFLGLSLFVTYAAERGGIREVVWFEQAGVLDRLDRISTIITKFELLDLTSPAHAAALDDRLNQSSLVGAAIIYHEAGFAPFALGATIPPWTLIPRVVWPNKPAIGGSGSIVTDFTGISFAEGTSVGVGQVAEFYINFGIPGVLTGFFGLACLLMRLDQGIMRSLATDDMRGLLPRAMAGLMMLNPGGSLQEVLVSCAAAYVTAHLIMLVSFFDIPARSRRQLA